MQSVLLTGANGFVGHYLTQQLLEKGYTVIATGKGACRLPFTNPAFTWATLDFTNKEAVDDCIDKHQPGIIIHLGALSKPDECELNREAAFLTNVTGTLHLLQAAEQVKSFFIYASTDFVFEGTKLTYKEGDERKPVNYYEETKMLAEDAVMQYPHKWSIVRTVLVYGHPQAGRQNILTLVAAALQRGEALRIFNDQTRTPTYVEDLARAFVTILDRQRTGIFHISGNEVFTPYGLAVEVANFHGLNSALIKSETKETFQQPAARPPVTGFDLTRAQQELNYTVTPFKEGLKKTFTG